MVSVRVAVDRRLLSVARQRSEINLTRIEARNLRAVFPSSRLVPTYAGELDLTDPRIFTRPERYAQIYDELIGRAGLLRPRNIAGYALYSDDIAAARRGSRPLDLSTPLGRRVLTVLRRNTPRETGRLRRSIQVIPRGREYRVSWRTDYAFQLNRRRPYALRAIRRAFGHSTVRIRRRRNGWLLAIVRPI